MGRWSDGPKSSAAEGTADEPVGQAAVEADRHDVTREVCRLARADVGEPGQENRPDGIVVADDRRRLSLQCRSDAGKLPAVEKLAVRKMNVGEGDVAHLDDLGPSARQAARQSRRR